MIDNSNKKRGIALKSTLSILIGLQVLVLIYLLVMFLMIPGSSMLSVVLKSMILALAQITSLVLIFKWKKLGVYLYIPICIVAIVIGFTNPTDFIMFAYLNMIFYLITLVILYCCLRPVWNSMK